MNETGSFMIVGGGVVAFELFRGSSLNVCMCGCVIFLFLRFIDLAIITCFLKFYL